MEPTQAQELLGVLEAFYEPLPEPKARAYRQKLLALDYEAAARAINRCTDELRFLPAWSEVLERLPGGAPSSATTAESAWERACRSVRSGPRGTYSPAGGSPPTGADLDERTLAAARSVGLRRLEAALHANGPAELGYVRRDFLSAWTAHRDADRAGVLTPAQADARGQLNAASTPLALPPAMTDEERAANARRAAHLLGEAFAGSPPSAQEPPDVAGRYERALAGAEEVPAEVRAADRAQQRVDQRERFRQWQRQFEARQQAAAGGAS